MANCCPGTECQRIITIDYLNTFIGNDLQDSSGNAMHVTHQSGDTYCPTYGELTGGTLVQNWKQGTTANGDRDGVVIGGTYADNQCVKQEDLSMKYTRFKELDVSASPLTIPACSGTSTLSFVHKYTRWEKKHNNTCEGTTSTSGVVEDTAASEVAYSSSNNVFTISGNIVSVGKNNPNANGRSDSRKTTIGALVTFRGTDYTDTIVITQLGLTGSYEFWVTDYYIYNKRTECNGGPEFICSGGSYSAVAKHDRDDWDIYRWVDECGETYNTDTEKRNERTTQNITYDTYSSSFSDVSGTETEVDRYDNKSWAGYGDGCTWHQYCAPLAPCPDYKEWGEVNVTGTLPCTGGTVSFTRNVPYTAYTGYYENNECRYSTSASSSSVTISVSATCNKTTSSNVMTGTINHINYTVTQDAGPCCTTARTLTYEPVYIDCEAATNLKVNTVYTAATRDTCCNMSYPTGRTADYLVNVECNPGAARSLSSTEKGGAPFEVIQRGACQCDCIGTCNDFSWVDGINTISFGCDESTKKLDYELSCVSPSGIYNIRAGSNVPNYLNVNIVTGSTGGSVYVSIVGSLPAGFSSTSFTINYDAGEQTSPSTCSATVNVTMVDSSDTKSFDIAHPDGFIDSTGDEGTTITFGDKRINIRIT